MKKTLLVITGMICLNILFAQAVSTKQLQENARTLLQQGDFDNAVKALETARQQDPGSLDVLRDLAYANYLKRDFSKSIELGKLMVARPDADQQCFQMLGLSYKAIADYKEAGKLYRQALRKFPNSGVIYSEYGELSALDKEMDEAIVQWEKGIEVDPNYSGNYYNAAMYYSRANNPLRAALYGEIFLNQESYTTRALEFKQVLFNIYKNMLTPGVISSLQSAKTVTAFEKAILESLGKSVTALNGAVTVENLTSLRSQFLLDWIQEKQKKYPFRLFDHLSYLLTNHFLEAYHYWLFAPAANEASYQSWKNAHAKEADGFKKLQESMVFKIPAGQYYFGQ
jgi:tetratricopeptide (TPR) repeat protein